MLTLRLLVTFGANEGLVDTSFVTVSFFLTRFFSSQSKV
jgi:hypothetical protein